MHDVFEVLADDVMHDVKKSYLYKLYTNYDKALDDVMHDVFEVLDDVMHDVIERYLYKLNTTMSRWHANDVV